MKFKYIFIFSIIITFNTITVPSRKCYTCRGEECSTGPGQPVDCRIAYCGLDFNLPCGDVRDRSCKSHYEEIEKEGFSCLTSTSDKGAIEDCSCKNDLCNGSEPKCSERDLTDSQVRELLTNKCKDEVMEADHVAYMKMVQEDLDYMDSLTSTTENSSTFKS